MWEAALSTALSFYKDLQQPLELSGATTLGPDIRLCGLDYSLSLTWELVGNAPSHRPLTGP